MSCEMISTGDLQHLAITPGAKHAQVLPNDFFLYLRDMLEHTGRMATAAALVPVSKAFYGMFGPVIDYSHLTLREDNVDRVLCGVLAARSQTSNQPSPAAPSRKLANLNTCTHLTITDMAALRRLVSVYQRLVPGRIFTAVTHLSLGVEVVRELGYSDDEHLHVYILALQAMLSPAALCFAYPTNAQARGFLLQPYELGPAQLASRDHDHLRANPDEADEFGDALWRYHYYNGIANLVHDFICAWRPRSVMIHGMSEQVLPETPDTLPVKLRVFYVDRLSAGIDCSRMLDMIEVLRAREMAMRVALVDGPDDCSFEFIGAGLAEGRMGATSGDASGGEDELRSGAAAGEARDADDHDAHSRIRELFWSQFTQPNIRQVIEGQVRFVSRELAEPCVCCGGK